MQSSQHHPCTRFDLSWIETADPQHSCVRLAIDSKQHFEPLEVRSAATYAACIHGDSFRSTVWLEVEEGDTWAMDAVQEAVALMRDFSIGLVVSQGILCSHGPGPQAHLSLREAIASVNRHGLVWQPLAKQFVPAVPDHV